LADVYLRPYVGGGKELKNGKNQGFQIGSETAGDRVKAKDLFNM
jgi:hypothetical protein